MTLAALATAAGEYGLPLAVNAAGSTLR